MNEFILDKTCFSILITYGYISGLASIDFFLLSEMSMPQSWYRSKLLNSLLFSLDRFSYPPYSPISSVWIFLKRFSRYLSVNPIAQAFSRSLLVKYVISFLPRTNWAETDFEIGNILSITRQRYYSSWNTLFGLNFFRLPRFFLMRSFSSFSTTYVF